MGVFLFATVIMGVFGSEALRKSFESIPRFMLGGVNSIGVLATAKAWREGQPWLDELMTYLDGNRHHLEGRISRDLAPVTHVKPEATYLAWLDCRGLDVGPSPAAHFLERGRVALNDGADFGEHGIGFVRLNFATSRDVLDRILDRMAGCL